MVIIRKFSFCVSTKRTGSHLDKIHSLLFPVIDGIGKLQDKA